MIKLSTILSYSTYGIVSQKYSPMYLTSLCLIRCILDVLSLNKILTFSASNFVSIITAIMFALFL